MNRFIRGAVIAALMTVPAAAVAQVAPVRVEEDTECGRWYDNDRDRYCEVREYTLDARSELDVDAGQNGGIRVTGWDRPEVRVVARIQASSRNGDPREMARDIEILTGRTVSAEGPRTRSRRDSWAVNFDLMVPHGMTLRLAARNGGISLADVAGDVDARTRNGGLSVVGGAGRIRGHTTNGGLKLELEGREWSGAGVDLETTNGGVQILVPESYSAMLETGTVNGGMQLDIPVMVSGRIDREIRTQLGDGGALVRATTRNGGVVVRRR